MSDITVARQTVTPACSKLPCTVTEHSVQESTITIILNIRQTSRLSMVI
uniref:Uncharacterized protein n=1 Tax=Anguilla anguilla TaxID=7936 RepID=A0A0E9QV38_ANGAN